MEVNSGLNLYSLNQNGYSKQKGLDMLQINELLNEVARWIYDNIGNYFMLLCNEKKYYTVFAKKTYQSTSFIAKELKEVISSIDGELVEVEYNEQRAYEFWIKNGDTSNMYILFNYDVGVVEI